MWAEIKSNRSSTLYRELSNSRTKLTWSNTAAIDIVKAYSVSARTKHFERWIGYVRDLYQRSVIELSHLSTDQMPADIFTKALPVDPFTRFRHFLLGMP